MAAPKKYPDELRERATRLAVEARQDPARKAGALQRIGEQLGINPETLRGWVKQAEIDAGQAPGVTTAEAQRIKELEAEVRELRRANEMADSTGQRNWCCEIKQRLISGGISCRASMVISVVSRSSSRSVSTRRGGGSSTSPERWVARRRWSERWPVMAAISTGSRSGGSRAKVI
ncbi:MAG: transposase [Leucobacter sp.]